MATKTAPRAKRREIKSNEIESELLHNYEKFDFRFKKREFKFTEKQSKLIEIVNDPATKVVLIEGPAGTSKSLMGVYCGLTQLKEKKVDSIMYLRSVVESAQKSMGFLPGPQPYYAKILTDKGWTTMGELKIGDLVATPSGKFSKVIKTFEKGEKDVYEITTLDNRKTYACLDHLWEIQENNKIGRFNNPKVVTTEYIKNNLLNRHGKPKIALPKVNCIEFDTQDLPIDPYVLGVLLGDGSLADSISFTNIDADIIERVETSIDTNMSLTYPKNGRIAYTIVSDKPYTKNARGVQMTSTDGTIKKYESILFAQKDNPTLKRTTIGGRCKREMTVDDTKYEFIKNHDLYNNPIKNEIAKLGLLYKKAWEKSIPDIYKLSDKNQRLNLLRGLLDTDGCIKNNGEINLTTTSEKLADDVKYLVYSLGGKATIGIRDRVGKQSTYNNRQIITRRVSYEVNISIDKNPFHCKRKAEKFIPKIKNMHRTKIKSVEKIGSFPCKCIKIEDPKSLYITDDYIVTHNTSEDKLSFFTAIVDDKLLELVEPQDIPGFHLRKKIETMPINYIRGCSWRRTFVLGDEFQNCSLKETLSTLTRIGDSSVMVLCGDVNQRDIPNSGFAQVIDLFDNEESRRQGIHTFRFTEDDIVRSEIVKFIVKKFNTIK